MTDNRTPEDDETMAVHEAGHAVVAQRLDVEVIRASIIPDAITWGRVHHGIDNVRLPRELQAMGDSALIRDNARRWLVISTAGRAAQAEQMNIPPEDTWDKWGSVLWADELDREQQREVLAQLVLVNFTYDGYADRYSRYSGGASIGYWRDQLLIQARLLARQKVAAERDIVAKLAEALLGRRELEGDEVREIIG